MGSAQAVSNQSSTRIISINPATGVVLGDVPDMSAAEVAAAVGRARAAQVGWGAMPIRERCRKVKRFSSLLMKRAEEVIDLIVKEGGKTKVEALNTEIAVVADLVNYFAKNAPEMLGRETIGLHLLVHRKSYIHYVPRGVVGVIAPWNFPLSIPMGEVMMAVIAGNAVVLKPSEVTPLIALKARSCSTNRGCHQICSRSSQGGAVPARR